MTVVPFHIYMYSQLIYMLYKFKNKKLETNNKFLNKWNKNLTLIYERILLSGQLHKLEDNTSKVKNSIEWSEINNYIRTHWWSHTDINTQSKISIKMQKQRRDENALP